MRKLAATGLVGLALSGCGSEGVAVSDLSGTAKPEGFETYALPDGDVTFPYPTNWILVGHDPPGVATAATGGASVSIWAYRTAALVTDPTTAFLAMQRYLRSLRARDPNFVVTFKETNTVFEAFGFEIQGRTRIEGRRVMIRSVHNFRGVGEYVFDAIADPAVFQRVNSEVFQKMLVGLRFYGNPPAAQGATAPGAAKPTPAP